MGLSERRERITRTSEQTRLNVRTQKSLEISHLGGPPRRTPVRLTTAAKAYVQTESALKEIRSADQEQKQLEGPVYRVRSF